MQTFEEAIKQSRFGSDLRIVFGESVSDEYVAKLSYIHTEICKRLSAYPNFAGMDFCDVHAGGIQLRAYHKDVQRYTYGDQPTLKYDFSNCDEVIDEFVNMWKHYDTEEYLNGMLRFVHECEEYGWD